MEDLIKMLRTAEMDKALEILKSQGKPPADVEKYINEIDLKDRNLRDSQIGKIQTDKKISDTKIVTAVRIPINIQKKIVNTGTTFEVGEPVTLIPQTSSEEGQSKTAELVKRIWKTNRLDSKIQKLVQLKKSQTQGALQFYIADVKQGSMMQKLLTLLGFANQKKEVKVSILDNKKGSMYPYFDSFGDLKAFVWEFITLDTDGEEVNNQWVYDDRNTYKINDEGGTLGLKETIPHGFDKIPIVYVTQEHPEWYDVQEMIDRLEVSLSKLGASNDYSGHPMLKIFGEVENAPDKDEDGKAWIIPIKLDSEGKEIKGDVSFLTNPNSPESTKLELEKLEEYIEMVSQTPNVSLSKLKGIGDISAKAIRLLFIDAMMKAKQNEGDNRTMIERIISVLVSGIINTTNTGLSSEAKDLYFEIQFNSILPDDLKESADIISTLKNSGLISNKTAIEYLGMNEDTQEEIEMIRQEKEEPQPGTTE
jgi:SPP1 family phage portal protein